MVRNKWIQYIVLNSSFLNQKYPKMYYICIYICVCVCFLFIYVFIFSSIYLSRKSHEITLIPHMPYWNTSNLFILYVWLCVSSIEVPQWSSKVTISYCATAVVYEMALFFPIWQACCWLQSSWLGDGCKEANIPNPNFRCLGITLIIQYSPNAPQQSIFNDTAMIYHDIPLSLSISAAIQ